MQPFCRLQGYVCLHNAGMCSDGEVRLVVGETKREGSLIVEMCYNGVWGRVCADGWNRITTDVVCNQLGYNNSPSKLLNIKSNHTRYSYNRVCYFGLSISGDFRLIYSPQ